MAVTKIEGKLVNLFISTALDTPVWKKVVCEEDLTLDGKTDVSTRSTKCGVYKSKGNTNWTLTGSGMASSTPATDEVSADEILTIFQNGTDVLWKTEHITDDTILFRSGQGFFSAYSENSPEDNTVSFDYTLEADGTVDISA